MAMGVGGWCGDSVDEGATSTSARITLDATWTWSRPPARLMSAVPVPVRALTKPKPAVGWRLAKLVRAPNVRRPGQVLAPCLLLLSPLARKSSGPNVRTGSTRRWFPAHRIPVALSLYSRFICTFFCLLRGVGPLTRGFPRRLTASVGRKLC